MRANVKVQDREIRVSQSRSRLCDMPVPGAVCQPRAQTRRERTLFKGDMEGETGKGEGERKRRRIKPKEDVAQRTTQA